MLYLQILLVILDTLVKQAEMMTCLMNMKVSTPTAKLLFFCDKMQDGVVFIRLLFYEDCIFASVLLNPNEVNLDK